MNMENQSDFVKVSKIYQQEASIGPVPADQLVPWGLLIGLSFFVCEVLLSLGLAVWGASSVWLIASWWFLTGKKSYKYTDLWIMPSKDWVNWPTMWVSAEEKQFGQKCKMMAKEKVAVTSVDGKKTTTYRPFQLESNLHVPLRVSIGGQSFGCWLLNEDGDKWSAVIPFRLQGLHPQLHTEEIVEYSEAIAEAFKEFPSDEKITFHMGCFRNKVPRKKELERLAHTALQNEMLPISVLVNNEKIRIDELDEIGNRKFWEVWVFCTWTGNKNYREKDGFTDKILRSVAQKLGKTTRTFMGTQGEWEENLYCQLAKDIYENGYLPWRLLLETKVGLSLENPADDELWHWLWYRFNGRCTVAPEIPQIIKVSETGQGLQRQIITNTQKDTLSVALSGFDGKTSCPQHNGSREYIYLNHTIGATLTMEEAPTGWRDRRSQLRWQFDCLAASFVYDTEVWLEMEPGSKAAMRYNLEKIAKQAEASNQHTVEQGGGLDVGSVVREEESFEAQRKLVTGATPMMCAPLYVIYRDTEAQLDKACALMCRSFGTASVIRETNIAWRLWVETLPINRLKLLCQTSLFSNRRIILDTDTVAGLLPLTCYRPFHKGGRGVEFITDKGGQPIYVDLFRKTERAIITATSGGGKSVLGFRFIVDALAQGIPVVGMDISTGGDSTFATACRMLGDKAAFFNMANQSYNLVEPPDLRGMDRKVVAERLNRWKQFLQQALVGIAMGSIHDPKLQERVNALVVKMIQVFTTNPQIIDRYNFAFEQGFHSNAWQNIPTLHDLLNFCSKEKLGLKSFEEIDRLAINQIVNQISAKLDDPEIGQAIGRPSTIPPDPMVKIFALSGLNNDSNAQIMSLLAAMACVTNGLSHPRSLFVGDELSVLLSKPGFAEMVGTIWATGRKDGISGLLILQDVNAIAACSAASKIFQNTSIEMVGKTTAAAASAYVKYCEYDPDTIRVNATEAFYPDASEYFTKWLLKVGDRYWSPLRYYPGAMILAAVANSEDEKAARQRFISQYPQSQVGILKGTRDFAAAYIKVLRGGTSIKEIGI
ncbi:MAG: hypothetical protein F6K17_01030 [Okeania sp. SIO3C4]|nr:hypothetical protein [Okeania sp. SIO3C4]